MSNVTSINDDSIEPLSIPTTSVPLNNVNDISRDIQVDLDDYVETTFSTDTSNIKHHKITIVIGGLVLLTSIVIAVVALMIITTGVAQSIVFGLAIAGVMVGGASFLKSLIGIIYSKVKKNDDISDDLTKNAKRTFLIGAGLSIFGFISRMVVASVPDIGSYGQIIDKVGGTAYDMGTFSVFNALTQLVYNKLFANSSEVEGTVTEADRLEENKKRVFTSIFILSIGTGLAILGISLLIVGSIFLVGTGQVIALAFAIPLLASGLSLVMKNIMNFPWQAIKELFANRLSKQEQQVLSEEVLQNKKRIRKAFLSETDVLDISEEELKINEVQNISDFSLEKRIAIVVAIFLFLVALTLLLTSVFLAGPVFQIQLLSAVGGITLSSSVPFLISGISSLAVSLKNKKEHSKKVKIRNKKIVEEAKIPFDTNHLEKIIELPKILEQQRVLSQKFETKTLVILGGISILLGIGFMLLTLVPGVLSITGIIAIGTPFLIIGGLILIDKVVILLKEKLQKIQKRRESRKKRVAHLPNFVQEALEEVI